MAQRYIYQTYLINEFKKRKARNNLYSLRAFSRDLGVPSSKLSQYINGTCGLSVERAHFLCQKMQWTEVMTEIFVTSVEAAFARDQLTKETAHKKLNHLLSDDFIKLNLEKFSLISDWYHFAVLELTEMAGFQSDIHWIAQALGVSVPSIAAAVERLIHLGLLDCTTPQWKQLTQAIETQSDINSKAIKEYHYQMLDMARSKIETVPLDQRELGSVMFSIDQEQISEYKEMIRHFQKDISLLSAKSRNKDAIYVMNVQFLPLYQGRHHEK